MKSTLLELAQDISSAMDGDEFGSINDTFEAEQIVTIIRTVYRDITSNRNWPHLKKAFKLDALSDTTKPTHMKLPSGIKELCHLEYDTRKTGVTRLSYTEMKWLDNDAFLRMNNSLDNDATNVDVVNDPSGIQVLIRNDKAPKYYTSFDDEYLVFDSYDKAVEASLQKSKTQGIGFFMPEFTLQDDFVIDLPDEAFSALFNEAKSLAFLELRQTSHVKAEQEARRQQRWLSRKAWRADGDLKYPNYGRRTRK